MGEGTGFITPYRTCKRNKRPPKTWERPGIGGTDTSNTCAAVKKKKIKAEGEGKGKQQNKMA